MQDIYRGHTPKSIVFIGGKACIIDEYDLNMNNKCEAQTANIKIPLDNIDSSVFNDSKILENLHEVEIWSGYMEDVQDPDVQLEKLKEFISKRESQRFLTKRFDGYVIQPEWCWGNDGEYLDLSCIDWTGILREYKYPKNFEDGSTEVRNIVNTLQADIHGIKFDFDAYPGSARLGDFDNISNKRTYHSMGKSYWEILKECSDKLGYIIITEGKTIKFTPNKKSPFIWQLYYGPREKQEVAGVPQGQYFERMQIRYGQKGRVEKSNVVVEVLGCDYLKSGKDKQLRVVFPEDKAITSVTNYQRIVVPGNVKKRELKVIAETKYRELSSRLMTGTVDLPFANNFMNLWDIIELNPNSSKESMSFLGGYWFNVCSISEKFGKEGYTQTVEFESDPTLEKTVKRKIAPNYKTAKSMSLESAIHDMIANGDHVLEQRL